MEGKLSVGVGAAAWGLVLMRVRVRAAAWGLVLMVSKLSLGVRVTMPSRGTATSLN